MEIYFLTPQQAYPRLQELYINKGCTNTHIENILVPNMDQRDMLHKLMQRADQLLHGQVHKVEFVIMKSGVYWDFPFTWGTTIIALTERFFQRSKDEMLKVLIHEWVHLDQRRHPVQYERYYNHLGFRKANIDFGPYKSYLLRNPDADDYQWIWKGQYAPFAIIRNCKFHVLLLDVTNGTVHKVHDVPSYYNYFGTKRQLYHPNEIVAHLIAENVMS